MSIDFRPARADELQRAQELVVRSINDLTERHGFGPMATVRPPDFQLFSVKDDPDGLWVAEADGDIVVFALSWVCGDLWFLAELFVAPGHQGRGIGNKLLARTFEHARRTGATNKGLITFTFNLVSQGLYIRHGLLPRLPIYLFSVVRDTLMPHLREEKLRYILASRDSGATRCEHFRCLAREASSLPSERQHDERHPPLRRCRVHGLRLCFCDRSRRSRSGVASKGDERRL
jgi:GNAT superfamily N-acetyltransferase